MAARTEPGVVRVGGVSIHARTPGIKLTPGESLEDGDGGSFPRDGYAVARGVLDRLSLDIYATYALMLLAGKGFTRREERRGFHDRYADTLTESLLLHLRPALERATGLSLFPTYSYLRIYETGAVLKRHIDRPACEISASLTVGCDAQEPWPLRLESHGRQRAVTLGPGDMLLYRGREVPHWRERFGGGYWIQAFFHYVDANGPLAAHKFDGRSGIGVRPE